jgi:uncharacterized membrane protein YraQ (UPF0718 family)
MSRLSNRELESLLKTRPMVPAHERHAQRIIEASKSCQQNDSSAGLQWLYEMFIEFFQVKPVYVLAITLLLGLSQGFLVTEVLLNIQADNSQTENIHDFFYSDRSYP